MACASVVKSTRFEFSVRFLFVFRLDGVRHVRVSTQPL